MLLNISKITICLALLVALTSASSLQLRVRRQSVPGGAGLQGGFDPYNQNQYNPYNPYNPYQNQYNQFGRYPGQNFYPGQNGFASQAGFNTLG